MHVCRRTFLKGCGALAAATLSRVSLAAPSANHRLVVISLRGGWDALSAIVPRDCRYYRQARPTLALKNSLELDGRFGLHPALAALLPLWRAGQLALVTAAGLQHDSRSHFQAMARMEAAQGGSSGWLGRYLAGLPHSEGFPALAIGAPSLAWQGFSRTLTVDSLADLDFKLPREDLLVKLYSGPGVVQEAGRQALQALQIARKLAGRPYRSRQVYPESDFGQRLREAAHMLSCPELGVRALSLELEGWDTHSQQQEVLPLLLKDLAEGLLAFVQDAHQPPVTVVVLSEFGRRLAENDAGGTDHGHASAMLVLGHKVRGGLYGDWPGLAPAQLYDLEDLAVTTDYRTVLSEVLRQGLGCPETESIFPGFVQPARLGIL